MQNRTFDTIIGNYALYTYENILEDWFVYWTKTLIDLKILE